MANTMKLIFDFMFLHLREIVYLINNYWVLGIFYFIVLIDIIIRIMSWIKK